MINAFGDRLWCWWEYQNRFREKEKRISLALVLLMCAREWPDEPSQSSPVCVSMKGSFQLLPPGRLDSSDQSLS